MRIFFVAVLLQSFVFIINAQYLIKGRVLDKNQNGVPYSTIQLTLTDSTFVKGEVADSLGNFLLKDIQEGNYLLRISAMGYKTQIESININGDKALPPCILKESEVVLNDVVITGSSFIQKKDHLLVIPDKQSRKHAFGGYDLLYNLMIPGLQVNRKDKKVTAITGEATLYINGVKADVREVENLKPKDIERVEYYTLPVTGPFVGDNAAINYITKVYRTGGYVTLDGIQNIGYTKGDYNLGAKVSDKNMTYTFFAGANMRKHGGVKLEKQESMVLPNERVDRSTRSDNAAYKNNQQYAQFKMSHDTEKHHLSASAAFVRDDTPLDQECEILR